MISRLPREELRLTLPFPVDHDMTFVRRPRLLDEQSAFTEFLIRCRLAWSVFLGRDDVVTWNGNE